MIKIPKKSLAMHGESGSVEPSVGDNVSLDGLRGVVRHEDDTHAHVEPTEFHGVPLEADNKEPDPEETGNEDIPTDKGSDSKEKKDLLEALQRDADEGQ